MEICLAEGAALFITPYIWLLFWLHLLAVASVVGLAAIWTALGRTFWFWRACVLAGLLALTLPPEAYGMLLLLAAQSTVVILVLLTWRWFAGKGEEPRCRVQFTLRDLLLLTILVAVGCGVFVTMPTVRLEGWIGILPMRGMLISARPATSEIAASLACVGVVLGLLTAAAAAIGLIPRRWWARLIMVLVFFPSILISGWLLLWEASERFRRGPTERPWARRIARTGLILLSLGVVIPLGVIYVKVTFPPELPAVSLPEPNGFDDLIAAGQMFKNNTGILGTPDPDVATEGELRGFVANNSDAFERARLGLARNCRVPLPSNRLANPYDLIFTQNDSIREIARAFAAEGKLAELEGRGDDAVTSYLDTIRAGNGFDTGGLVVHNLVGVALRGIGCEALEELRASLSPEQCRELIAKLQSLSADSEPLDECFARDYLWAVCHFGWIGRFQLFFEAGTCEEAVTYANDRCKARIRLLIADLAIRCYRADQDALPETLDDLVPEYLPEVPVDPFSGKPVIYRIDGEDFTVYSIGEDQIDDGGSPAADGSFDPPDVVLEELEEDPWE